jgi:hypothetical protein
VTTENNETLERAVARMSAADATVDPAFAADLYERLLTEAEPLFATRSREDTSVGSIDLRDITPVEARRRSPFLLAAACVLVAGLAAGAVAWRANSRKPARITITSVNTTAVPAPTTSTPSAVTTVSGPSTAVAVTTTTTTTTTPATTEPSTRVSYLSPPPALTLRRLGSVAVPTSVDGHYQVAIGDLGVAVATSGKQDPGRIHVVGFDGKIRTVNTSTTGIIAYGPGDVAYTTTGEPLRNTFAVVAVPLAGPKAGTVVASQSADVNRYIEYPMASFGHGASGVIMRRDAGATSIGYVDVDGLSTTLGTPTPAFFSAELQPDTYRPASVRSSTGTTWSFTIQAAPGAARSYSPPAPTDGGAGVYWNYVGPNLDPSTQSGVPTIGVIARITDDGAARWWSLPTGWDVVASDLWGTVLAHLEGDQLQLALAEFSEALPKPFGFAACPASAQRVPTGATKIGPVDLDRDGVDDVTLWIASAEFGSTLYAERGGFVLAEVTGMRALQSDPPLAVVDLDGDGRNEVFLASVGNTARSALVIESVGCAISPVRPSSDDASPNDYFETLIGAGGNTCGPTGCFVKNTCVTRNGTLLLEHVESVPVTTIIEDPSATAETAPIRLTTELIRFANRRFTVVDRQERTYPSVADLPADAPSRDSSYASDRIDC